MTVDHPFLLFTLLLLLLLGYHLEPLSAGRDIRYCECRYPPEEEEESKDGGSEGKPAAGAHVISRRLEGGSNDGADELTERHEDGVGRSCKDNELRGYSIVLSIEHIMTNVQIKQRTR